MPPPRFCSSPRVRSNTVTSQPQRDSAIAAAQPAMLPPTTATVLPRIEVIGSSSGSPRAVKSAGPWTSRTLPGRWRVGRGACRRTPRPSRPLVVGPGCGVCGGLGLCGWWLAAGGLCGWVWLWRLGWLVSVCVCVVGVVWVALWAWLLGGWWGWGVWFCCLFVVGGVWCAGGGFWVSGRRGRGWRCGRGPGGPGFPGGLVSAGAGYATGRCLRCGRAFSRRWGGSSPGRRRW